MMMWIVFLMIVLMAVLYFSYYFDKKFKKYADKKFKAFKKLFGIKKKTKKQLKQEALILATERALTNTYEIQPWWQRIGLVNLIGGFVAILIGVSLMVIYEFTKRS